MSIHMYLKVLVHNSKYISIYKCICMPFVRATSSLDYHWLALGLKMIDSAVNNRQAAINSSVGTHIHIYMYICAYIC